MENEWSGQTDLRAAEQKKICFLLCFIHGGSTVSGSGCHDGTGDASRERSAGMSVL